VQAPVGPLNQTAPAYDDRSKVQASHDLMRYSDRLWIPSSLVMPRISQFSGIVIYTQFNDHSLAHFHTEYGEFEAVYTIDTLEIPRGIASPRAQYGARMGNAT
jgi:hypothetical protein